MSSLKTNSIEAESGSLLTVKSRLFVDIGSASFELTPARIAAINAEISAANAASSAYDAYVAKLVAVAASEASGDVRFFDTYALAEAARAGLPDQQIVEVIIDETMSSHRIRYRKESGIYVFKIDLTPDTGVDLDQFGSLAFLDRVAENLIDVVYINTNSGFVANSNTRYIIDNSMPNIQVTLPSAPNVNDFINFVMTGGSFIYTILSNGNKIMNLSEDMMVDQYAGSFSLVFRSTSYGWIVV